MKRKQKVITLIISCVLLFTLAIPSNLAFATERSTLVDFSTNEIQKAGINDRNFAKAIYDSIVLQQDEFLDGNTLEINTYSSIEELLNSFTGKINASGKSIRNIEGITILKSMTSLDLSNNLIKDIRPLSVANNATELNQVTNEQQKYYGIPGINCKVDLKENAIHYFPFIFGGRFDFSPTNFAGYEIQVNELNLIYINDGEQDFSKEYNIIIGELYIGSNQIDFMENYTTLITPSIDFPDTKDPLAYIPESAEKGGNITEMPVAGIKRTGTFDLSIGSMQLIWWYTAAPRDGTTPNGDSPKFYIPVQTEIYSKIERGSIDTKNSVSLVKLGMDDNLPKAGAEYSLFKKSNHEVVAEKLTTGEDGVLKINLFEEDEYYFVETKAPKGYELNTEPINFTVVNGTVDILGGSGNKLNPTDGDELTIDGSFVLSGSDEAPASIKINEPHSGMFDNLMLNWTEGNQGGIEGKVTYQIGSGTSTDELIYIATKEEAEQQALIKLKENRDLYQNVKISASFTQKIELKQIDKVAVTVDKTVEKIWNDNNNQEGMRTRAISVQLYANNKAVGEAITLNEDTNWTYTWTGLNRKDEDMEIIYSINEVVVPDGYIDKIEIDENGNFTLINTYRTNVPDDPTDPTDPAIPNEPSNPDNAINTPNTGDTTNLQVTFALFTIMASLILQLMGKGKKRNNL